MFIYTSHKIKRYLGRFKFKSPIMIFDLCLSLEKSAYSKLRIFVIQKLRKIANRISTK